MVMSQGEREDISFKINRAFNPAAPIDRKDLFQGRQQQIQAVLGAINQSGQHLVIYGERGVGKTSLANMIALNLRNPLNVIMAPHINCTSIRSYSELWEAQFTEIAFKASQLNLSLPVSTRSLVRQIEKGECPEIDQHLVRRLITGLIDSMEVVLIFDEFDSLEDIDTKLAMAETIKLFSDRKVDCTIVLVGVSEDVEKLIEGHRSIERCIAQVKMPRMSRDEVEDIVSATLAKPEIEMAVDDSSLHEISRIAKGLPHFAHQIGLHSALKAIAESSRRVTLAHVDAGIALALESTQGSILNAYQRAITSTAKSLYKEVLLACALAECDEFGCFAPKDVRSPLAKVLGRDYKVESFARHLHSFCKDERGPMLMLANLPGRARFRFANPLLEPFVLLKGFSDRILTHEILASTRETSDGQQRMF